MAIFETVTGARRRFRMRPPSHLSHLEVTRACFMNPPQAAPRL